MCLLIRHTLFDPILTFKKLGVNCIKFLLKLNKPIVSKRRELPMASRKGIITFTLVISRVSIKPTVTRRLYVYMSIFNLFAVKTKFEYQIEEYIEFKEKTSPFIAKDHKEILLNFKKELRHYSIAQLQLEDIREYHRKIRAKMTHFSTIKNMQAIRAFIRFHKAKTNIKADTVTNIGVKNLQIVGENVTVTPMIRKKVGRPLNIELAKKIKRLRDIEHLSFRAIGKAINQDVKSVYRWYKADLSDTNVG